MVGGVGGNCSSHKGENGRRLFGIEADQTVLLDPKAIDFVYAEKERFLLVLERSMLKLG